MSNLATITNNILADSGIDDINVVVTTGSYANPAWITSLAWTKITGAPLGDYLPLVGGTMTGNINWAQTDRGITWAFNTDGASIKFYNTADGDTNSRLEFATIDNNDEYFRWVHIPSGGSTYESMRLVPNSSGNAQLIVSGSIIKSGGTSSQYLMADGSVSTLSNPVTGTGSAGQVAYWSSSSAITGESNLFWDSTNDRLSIGTASANSNLTVSGSDNTDIFTVLSGSNSRLHIGTATSGTIAYVRSQNNYALNLGVNTTNYLTILSSGNVGINTATPATSFEVNGVGLFSGSSLAGNTKNGVYILDSRIISLAGSGARNLTISAQTLSIETGITYSEKFKIFENGNVVISTSPSDAGFKLDVNGTGRFSGALTGTSASFGDVVTNTSGGYRTSVQQGYILRNDANSVNLGGLTRRSFWAGGTALDTQIFAETGYSIFLNPGGSSSIGLTLASTGAATFSSSVTATNALFNSTSTQLILQNTDGGTNAERIGMFMTGGDTFKILSLNDNNTTRVDNIIVANVLSGNVGIGTTSLNNLVTFTQTIGGSPANLSELEPFSTVKIKGRPDRNNIVYIGAIDALTGMLIQSGTTSAAANLSINPFGGNVLIGTTTDAGFKLDVNGTGRFLTNSNGFVARFTGGATGGVLGGFFANSTAGFASIGVQSNHEFRLFTNDTDRLTINGSTGAATFANLAGSGNRIVVANSGGTLISAVIGSGLAFDGTTLTATGGGSGSISGSGTSGFVPVFSGATSISNSIIQSASSGITVGSGQNTFIRLGLNSGDWGEVQYSGGVTTLRNGWDNTSAYVQQLVNGQYTRLFGSGLLDQNRTSEGTFYRLQVNGSNRMVLSSDGSTNALIRTGNNVDLRLGVNEDAITIKNGGNVGIGTPAPANPLVVQGSNTIPQFRIIRQENTNQGFTIRVTGGETYFNSYDGSNIVYGSYLFQATKGSDTQTRMTIANSGNVIVGTSTDNGSLFRILGPNGVGTFFDAQNAGAAGATFARINASSVPFNQYTFANGNVIVGGIVTATSFFESSDATIKTLVQDNYQAKGIESVVAKLYIKNGKQELGYFAQDLEDILPSAVNKGSDGLLNLSYREVHTAKIAALEKRIIELESQLKNN
jgi:hypothetical protein